MQWLKTKWCHYTRWYLSMSKVVWNASWTYRQGCTQPVISISIKLSVIDDMHTQTPIFCFLISNVTVMRLPYFLPPRSQTNFCHSTDKIEQTLILMHMSLPSPYNDNKVQWQVFDLFPHFNFIFSFLLLKVCIRRAQDLKNVYSEFQNKKVVVPYFST